MRLTKNAMASLKEQMVQSADKLKNFLNTDFQTGNQFAMFVEQVSAYFRLQTDEFYKCIRAICSENNSSLKKIDFLENDLKLLKVRLYEFYESFGQANFRTPKGLANRQLQSLIKEVRERIKLEEDFLHPLMA